VIVASRAELRREGRDGLWTVSSAAAISGFVRSTRLEGHHENLDDPMAIAELWIRMK
jgi:hypothetical protein